MKPKPPPPLEIKDGKIYLHGLPVEVKSDEECNKADYHLCARVKTFPCEPSPNHGIAQCFKCGEDVYWDTRVKVDKPKKVCVQCIIEIGMAEKDGHQEFPA